MAEYFYGTNGHDNLNNAPSRYDIKDGVIMYGYAGNDTITNKGKDAYISGGDDNDTISNSNANNATIHGDGGHDKITSSGSNARIYGESGNDYISNNGDYAYIDGGNDKDTIKSWGNNTSIYGGAGDDYIGVTGSMNYSRNAFLSGGSGDDTIVTQAGIGISISGGTGDDYIKFESSKAPGVIQYAAGDGNDVIYGFNGNSTLNISGSKYSTVVSGNDVIVTVGNGKITLVGAKDKTLNIVGTSGGSGGSGGSSGGSKSKKASIPSTALRYNGHSYYVYSGVADTWEAAKAYCEARGGHLAVINNAAENSALFTYMKQTGHNSAYFGLSDATNEGTWTWSNGDSSTYRNWASSEPNGGTYENYGMFYSAYPNGEWNDGNFKQGTVGDTNAFICEWDTVSSNTKNGINLYNDTANKKINGTSYADSIRNSGGYVKISTGKGNDKIYNEFGNNTSIVAGTGNDSIYNRSFYTTIVGGDGKDTVYNYNGEWASISTGNGNDSIYNVSTYDDDGHYVTINSGAGNDKIKNEFGDHSKIIAGSGNDSIYNRSFSTTIDGGSGNDTITVFESWCSSINGGKGNDKIILSGNNVSASSYVSVKGGTGNDSLWGSVGDETFIYAKGDGKDVIYGFGDNDMLKITGTFSASYNSSKDEVYFKVGSTTKAITLRDFDATSFNINGTYYRINNKNKLIKS